MAYIEAISAMDTLTSKKPAQQMKYIQMTPAVPPLISPIVDTLHAMNTLADCLEEKMLKVSGADASVPE